MHSLLLFGSLITFVSALRPQMATPKQGVVTGNIKLSSFETSFEIMEIAGTTTISFFSGNMFSSYASMRKRFKEVAQRNPWIVGSLKSRGLNRLSVQPKKGVYLTHPLPEDVTEFDAALQKACPTEPSAHDSSGTVVRVHPDMSFDDIIGAVRLTGGRLDKGSVLVDDDSKVVSKWMMLPGINENSFAFVLSISHVVADGFTYYSILSMLSADSPLYALDATRSEDARSRCIKMCGEAETNFMTSAPQVLNWTRRIFCSREKRVAMFIDKLKVLVNLAQVSKDVH